MNILAFGAHPDDVEEMCFGTLMKYRAQGDTIFIALSTSGNIGSNCHASREEIAAIREKEQLQAAAPPEAKVKFLRFDDEELRDTPETRNAFLNAIRWANPDVILTHSPADTSTDHAATSKLITEVLLVVGAKLVPTAEPPMNKMPALFFWDIPGGFKFEPQVYVDITPMMEQKLAAIACHQSQMAWMEGFLKDEYLDSMRAQSRFRGYQCGCHYAEGFIAFQALGFVADYRLLPR